MKKILLSVLSICFCVAGIAQDSKPTKEQTIEYIINTLKGYSIHKDFPIKDNTSFSDEIEIEEINFNNCTLTIKIRIYEKRFYESAYDGFNDSKNVFQLNLKDIEKVAFADQEIFKWQIIFYSFNAKKLFKNDFTYANEKGRKENNTSMVSTCYIPVPKDEKLVQAFNHLRKLCGAQEPIKF